MVDMVDIDGEDFIFSVDTTAPSLPEFSSSSSPSSYSSPSPSLPSSFNHLDHPSPAACVEDLRRFLLKSPEVVETPSPPPPETLADGLELFGDFDLFDTSNPFLDDYENNTYGKDIGAGGEMFVGGGEGMSSNSSEDLGKVFLEWLKENKDAISPEDLRSIKLKRSTVECAVRRLGGGKEGMKKLLKLILDWVQNHQLRKRKRQPQQQLLESRLSLQPPHFPHCGGANGGECMPFSPPLDLHNMDNQSSFRPPSSAESSAQLGSSYTAESSVGISSTSSRHNGTLPGPYPGQPPYQQAKEARKKRMARHRRFS